MIGCFGDFNSDNSLDALVISNAQSSSPVLQVYLLDAATNKYTALDSAIIRHSPHPITACAAADFDYDGKVSCTAAAHLHS